VIFSFLTSFYSSRSGVNVRVMVFKATFNNISVLSLRSALLVEETDSTWRKPRI
jgi:hypothetical protein